MSFLSRPKAQFGECWDSEMTHSGIYKIVRLDKQWRTYDVCRYGMHGFFLSTHFSYFLCFRNLARPWRKLEGPLGTLKQVASTILEVLYSVSQTALSDTGADFRETKSWLTPRAFVFGFLFQTALRGLKGNWVLCFSAKGGEGGWWFYR